MQKVRMMGGASVLLSLLILTTISMVTVRGDTAACISMSVYVQIYSNLQQSVETLMGQMTQMRNSLDSTITSSCGDVTPVILPPFNLTYCDFEDGHMCNYTQDKDDNRDFTLTTGSYPDQTLGTKQGTYVRNDYSSSYTYHSRITSPLFTKSTAKCLRFYYRSQSYSGVSTSHIEVFVKEPGRGHGNAILDLNNIRTEWTRAEVEIDPEYLKSEIQLQFDIHARDYIMIDDIAVYDVHCSNPGVRKPLCNGNHTFVNGSMTSCYSFHIEPRTWRDALLTCKNEWADATLVAIDSYAEQLALVNAIKGNQALLNTGQFGYWTTGNDVDIESTFTWSGTHNPLTYTNWHAGQPNNVGGNQDCVLMQYLPEFEWGDVDCGEKHPFICEQTYSNI